MKRNDVVKAMFSIWKHSKEHDSELPNYYYGVRVAITSLAGQIDVQDDLDTLIDEYLSKDSGKSE